jgi:uncharacterized membrane protein YkvA (DUF1232 family)
MRGQPALWKRWNTRARHLKRELYTLGLACRDPRVPWYARLFLTGLLAYAFSPLDLIPDFIPVLGYLDDLILLPLGVLLAMRMIPTSVIEENRLRAEELLNQRQPVSWRAAIVVLLIWLLFGGLIILWLCEQLLL